MHEYLHDLGAKRIHWRYDDPSGVPDLPSRVRPGKGSGLAAGEIRVHSRSPQFLRIA